MREMLLFLAEEYGSVTVYSFESGKVLVCRKQGLNTLSEKERRALLDLGKISPVTFVLPEINPNRLVYNEKLRDVVVPYWRNYVGKGSASKDFSVGEVLYINAVLYGDG
jgi:hypothetical protein